MRQSDMYMHGRKSFGKAGYFVYEKSFENKEDADKFVRLLKSRRFNVRIVPRGDYIMGYSYEIYSQKKRR